MLAKLRKFSIWILEIRTIIVARVYVKRCVEDGFEQAAAFGLSGDELRSNRSHKAISSSTFAMIRCVYAGRNVRGLSLDTP
jgi:hypothetical protein